MKYSIFERYHCFWPRSDAQNYRTGYENYTELWIMDMCNVLYEAF